MMDDGGAAFQHTFPVLKPSDLCDFLEDLKFPMSIDNLKNPTPKGVRDVYMHFIELLMGISWDQMQQPQLQAAEMIGFPELHKESIPQITFTHTLCTLLENVGCPDFTQHDLYNPRPKRLICHLSALINFARFREDVLLKYEEFSQETHNLLLEQEELEARADETSKKIHKIRSQREAEQPLVEDLQREEAELAGEVETLRLQKRKLEDEENRFNAEIEARKSELSDIKFNKLSVKQAIDELQGQRVSSPEKLKRNIRDLGEAIQVEREKIRDEGLKLQKMESEADALALAQKQLARVTKQLDEIEGEVDKLEAAADNVDNVKTKREQAAAVSRDLENQLQSINRQITSCQEKAVRQERMHKSKMDKAKENLSNVQEEMTDVMRQREEKRKNDDLNAQIARKIEDKIQANESEHERAVAELTLQVEQIHEAMTEYHRTLYTLMESSG